MNDLEIEWQIVRACDLLRRWSDEGRAMPFYTNGFGRPHLCLLVGCTNSVDDYYIYKMCSRLIDQLLGPHGWAVYCATLHQRDLITNHEEKQRAGVQEP